MALPKLGSTEAYKRFLGGRAKRNYLAKCAATERRYKLLWIWSQNPSIGMQELANELGVSRVTVWSDIKKLRGNSVSDCPMCKGKGYVGSGLNLVEHIELVRGYERITR